MRKMLKTAQDQVTQVYQLPRAQTLKFLTGDARKLTDHVQETIRLNKKQWHLLLQFSLMVSLVERKNFRQNKSAFETSVVYVTHKHKCEDLVVYRNFGKGICLKIN